jgi:hypothetical protein
MYDIKQVTRYVLVRSGGDYRPETDLAEFKRRDEAEMVRRALSGYAPNTYEGVAAGDQPATVRGTTAQQDAARTVFRDGVCIKCNYGKLAAATKTAPTEYDF